MIGIYSPERSVADAFRLRGEVGHELARDALRVPFPSSEPKPPLPE